MIAYSYESIRRQSSAPASKRAVLAICGGGNAGHALAVVASQNFNGDIVWLAGSEEKADLLRRGVFSQDGLRSTGVITGSADKVRIVSSNPADVIPSADIVMMAVPAFAHATILRKISPFLKGDALIGCLPTRGGFEFEATLSISGVGTNGGRRIFGLQTLPWSTRVQQPGKIVNVGALKARVLMATLPRQQAPEIAAQLSEIIGTQIVPTENFLNMTLGNPGQIVHAGIMYGLFSKWDGREYREADIPYFYAGVTDQTAAFVELLSSEALEVARRVEARSAGALDLSGVLSIHEWLRISYPTQTADVSNVGTCFRTGPLQARKAPMLEGSNGAFVPNFKYRYLSEDVPFGLAIVKAVAQIAEVKTPAIDAVLSWTQEKLEKRYLIDGLLDGPDTRELPIPQNSGIKSLRDLIEWYAA